jgi:hypothetical protein
VPARRHAATTASRACRNPESHLRKTSDERCARAGYAQGSGAGGLLAFAGVFIAGANAAAPSHTEDWMNRIAYGIAAAAFAALTMTAPVPAFAVVEGKSTQGGAFVSGGVTVGELRDLEGRKKDYRLWILTAAKGSGAHLAGVHVKITDAKGQVVIDTEMDGPWLLADLKPGRYSVEAKHNEQTLRRTTTVPATGLRQVILYFDSTAELSPDLQRK